MIARMTNVMAGAVVWAMSTPHRRDRRAQIDFYATRMWNESDSARRTSKA